MGLRLSVKPDGGDKRGFGPPVISYAREKTFPGQRRIASAREASFEASVRPTVRFQQDGVKKRAEEASGGQDALDDAHTPKRPVSL